MGPLQVFFLELLVVGLAGVALVWGAFADLPGRWLGGVVTVGLLGVLVASFYVDVSGHAPGGVYLANDWTLFLERLLLVAGALGALGAMDWLHEATPRRLAEYYVMMLLSLAGMMLLPGVRDWVLLVVAFELMGVPLVVLAAWAKQDAKGSQSKLAAEAALKLFVTSAASSAVTLFGLALVTGLTGTTRVFVAGGLPHSPLLDVGMLMVLGGLAFKVGAVPFHFWVPDTYEGAPTPFVAFLSVAPKVAGLATLAVVLLGSWGGSDSIGVWWPGLAAMSVAGMAVGNFFALPQTDVRRLLAFSGIAQVGYVLVALLARSESGLSTALFFLATYLFTNVGAFFVLHAAAEESGGHTFERLVGLSRRSPVLGAALLVFLLSLAGIPFVAGFWAKLFIFLAAWRAGLWVLVLAGLGLAVVGLYYYLTVARWTFMSEGSSTRPVRAGAGLWAAIAVCLVAVLGLGLWPQPLVDHTNRAARAFFLDLGSEGQR
jgi:NADH-quinone oxidoreductase subunit N